MASVTRVRHIKQNVIHLRRPHVMDDSAPVEHTYNHQTFLSEKKMKLGIEKWHILAHLLVSQENFPLTGHIKQSPISLPKNEPQ